MELKISGTLLRVYLLILCARNCGRMSTQSAALGSVLLVLRMGCNDKIQITSILLESLFPRSDRSKGKISSINQKKLCVACCSVLYAINELEAASISRRNRLLHSWLETSLQIIQYPYDRSMPLKTGSSRCPQRCAAAKRFSLAPEAPSMISNSQTPSMRLHTTLVEKELILRSTTRYPSIDNRG